MTDERQLNSKKVLKWIGFAVLLVVIGFAAYYASYFLFLN